MNDEELERAMRAGLERHAQDVDTAIVVPSRPRRPRWLVPLAAAAAVGLVAAGVGLLRDDDPVVDGTPISVGPPPADWRVESWHGVQVFVPPDWGWGGAPVREDGEELLDCGAAAFVDAHGRKLVNGDPDLPYVGRPVDQTDVCQVRDDRRPTAPYVWLGAPIELGQKDLGGGWTQQTVKVAGETVTVATDDQGLRQQILGSVRPNDGEDCAPTIRGIPDATDELVTTPTGMSICAYTRADAGLELVYATALDGRATAAFLATLAKAPRYQCADTYSEQWVVLRVHGAGNTSQDLVAATDDCTFVVRPDGTPVELTGETVAPWAVGGIPAYVVGPHEYSPELQPYFRGMLG